MPDNLAIWNVLGRTSPEHTKGFKRGGGFSGTAVKPIYTEQKMTELFGPCGIGWAPNNTTASLAWAAMAGLSYDITPNLKVDVGYRYLDMGKADSATIRCVGGCRPQEHHHYELASNDIRVGLRWMFNTPAPVYQAPDLAPPPPLVRKY